MKSRVCRRLRDGRSEDQTHEGGFTRIKNFILSLNTFNVTSASGSKVSVTVQQMVSNHGHVFCLLTDGSIHSSSSTCHLLLLKTTFSSFLCLLNRVPITSRPGSSGLQRLQLAGHPEMQKEAETDAS